MPANLTPQYMNAEKKYKEARTDRERLQALKEMLATIPKHKGTDKLQADIKRRIARLREEMQHGGKGSKHQFRFHVDKEGLPQLVLVGLPNVGKSQLLAALTNATPEIASYPYTTRMYLPGVMTYLNYQIQIVDLPAISDEYMEFWVPEIIKHANGVLLVIDLNRDDPLEQLELSLQILEQHRIILTKDEFKADPYQPETYLPGLIIANKGDGASAPDNWQVLQELYENKYSLCPVSASTGTNLEELKRLCIDLLGIIRVYSKPPGKAPNRDKPFIMKRGETLLDFARLVHHDFAENLKFARVWGAAKFNGQRIKADYVLNDEDIIELHI